MQLRIKYFRWLTDEVKGTFIASHSKNNGKIKVYFSFQTKTKKEKTKSKSQSISRDVF